MRMRMLAVPLLAFALAACQPAGESGADRGAEPPADQPGQAAEDGTRAGDTGTTPGAMQTAPEGEAGVEAQSAEAEILATEGHDTAGLIRFMQVGDGVRIQGTVSGLTPGEHGFHIHATGDCSAPDASSAGDHFNPDGTPHGAPDDPPAERHRGDFGNIVADEDGNAEIDLTDSNLRMSGPDSIIGKAVIVHAGRDDLESQPSGNAGARVGCGVIQPVGVSGSTSL